ncbi:MAG: TIGR01212 family radical SAM protein [Saccharofermentans sp.]|jgi:radical SAM protein (TIGR01212 family)|nr:TIGR01212 family radical SAM protein [Mageeibacillus sp.]MCI1264204.1 TIGR01212 family radical SAM protein [Saccharofermentans sp.]MCI1275680.1 TIGR01212 family radical SAM protein [Saccharofermentans sp.]MCI2044285.1 TIGR01212 family radical SAM protein [Mageeibacillus sp.]
MITANQYYKDRFGHKMYKASISLNVTCPNRDGTKGTGGCIFCSAGGSGEFAVREAPCVTVQIDRAIARVANKAGHNAGYIAYFQSNTNTYCEPAYLRNVLKEASMHPKVEALSVATRPDCLSDGIIEVLADCARGIPLFVELGLQTSSDRTASVINRCYATSIYGEAVERLHSIGANVITHVIFGLPGETEEQMLSTVSYACDCGTDGIKFTCLYVLEGTELAKLWKAGSVAVLEREEYFEIVAKALALLPPGVVVHRLTGDGPKSLLLAPLWTANKREVVNYINRRFRL